MPGNKTRSAFLHAIILVCLVLGLLFILDVQKPDCVQAQTCIPIAPVPVVQLTDDGSGGGCDTKVVNLAFSGVMSPWMALKEFDYEYRSNDHNGDHFSADVPLGSYNFGPSSVNYTVKVCFDDRNNDDDYDWQVRYLILRWR